VLNDTRGLLAEISKVGIPRGEFAFNLAVFLLGVFTLTFSWYGFNASVSKKPVLYGSIAGMGRFFLDAFLVLIYGFILVKYDNFPLVFISILLIYWLYAVWDGLRIFEYQNDPFVASGLKRIFPDQNVSAREIRQWRPIIKNTVELAFQIWGRQSLQWALLLTFTAAGWYGAPIFSPELVILLLAGGLYLIFSGWDLYTTSRSIDIDIHGQVKTVWAVVVKSNSAPISAALIVFFSFGIFFNNIAPVGQYTRWTVLLILYIATFRYRFQKVKDRFSANTGTIRRIQNYND
jgi:hypothetical protein